MRPFQFYKFSPSGNTTLFLTGEKLPDKALLSLAMGTEGICAEQAAFADTSERHLEMAGGEFCANACRAMGALLDLDEQGGACERNYAITVSGHPGLVRLAVKGKCPCWQVEATFQLTPEDFRRNGNIFELPGISHLLLETDKLPEIDEAPSLATAHVKNAHDDAFGVIWWRAVEDGFEILPYVIVPAAGTAMVESSCGSATMALALLQAMTGAKSGIRVRQPSGCFLQCSVDQESMALTLGGNVRLCASGLLWLPENGLSL